jgi:hypothetical protein
MTKVKEETKKKATKKKIKIENITVGLGDTRNIGNFEFIRVFTEFRVTVQKDQKVGDLQLKVRNLIIGLNDAIADRMQGKGSPLTLKEDKEVKIVGIVSHLGETRSTGNYENVKINNGLEGTVLDGQNAEEVLEAIIDGVIQLNKRDFNTVLTKG